MLKIININKNIYIINLDKSSNGYGKSRNSIVMRVFTFIILSVILPLAIRIIKKKLIENRNLLCYKCQRKLEKINKNEYYCKNCKIIRIDNNNP
jgi:hypothetical protein